MSSLKDIMDVDVEPLEAHAYRRSKEAAQRLASQISSAPASATQTSSGTSYTPVKVGEEERTPTRRRSNRISKPSTSPITSSQQPVDHQRSSILTDEVRMDFTQTGEPSQISAQMSPQQSSTGVQRGPEIPVKYTPVTGRISRAKKGVPVHICDICRPIKTFTRAEHLRRHQLSHQRPAYPCTFEECERAFHRPDLLARHQQRHESQGEKPYKAGGSRSRASSSASESQIFSMAMEEPSQRSMPGLDSGATSAGAGSSLTALSSSTILGSFQTDDYSPTAFHKRDASQAQLADSRLYTSSSADASNTPRAYDQVDTSFTTSYTRGRVNSSEYCPTTATDFTRLYPEGGRAPFSPYTMPILPLLRIPEDCFPPGLSYTQENSPWCSSASDSTYSTLSDGSRNGPHWRSISDWPAVTNPWPAANANLAAQDLETMISQMGSPYVSPISSSMGHRNLRMQNFEGYHQMDSDTIEPTQRPALMICRNMTSSSTTSSQLDSFLSSYWVTFDQLFPIIHHATFDSRGYRLLRLAMAAIGTQYNSNPNAQLKGAELNELCRMSFVSSPHLDLEDMQAIVLTELFMRFRGRKTSVRTSQDFGEVYSRLVINSNAPALCCPNSGSINARQSNNQLVDGFQIGASEPEDDFQSEWVQWIATESRQRLLGACFIVDVHQAFYHEKFRSKRCHEQALCLLRLPCSEDLWNAKTASEWHSLKSKYSFHTPYISDLDLSTTAVTGTSCFGQSLLICYLASRLPVRHKPNYPNDFYPDSRDPDMAVLIEKFPTSFLVHTYLAIYYTPLHDLLAIAGDTWVFSKKITPPSEFHAAQSRLRTWSSSLAAAAAAQHACHALSLSLSQPETGPEGLSLYWGLYISSIICWAFGNRYQPASTGYVSADTDDSSETCTASSSSTFQEASMYIDSMLSLNVHDLLTSKETMRAETAGVIDAVKAKLEITALSSKCGMLVDAICVLGRLKEGRGKWF